MKKNDVLIIVVFVEFVLNVLLCMFIFGFCIPIIDDFRTQIEIHEARGETITLEEYKEWRNK